MSNYMTFAEEWVDKFLAGEFPITDYNKLPKKLSKRHFDVNAAVFDHNKEIQYYYTILKPINYYVMNNYKINNIDNKSHVKKLNSVRMKMQRTFLTSQYYIFLNLLKEKLKTRSNDVNKHRH